MSFLKLILTLLHSERPKLYAILAFLSAIRLLYIAKTVLMRGLQHMFSMSNNKSSLNHPLKLTLLGVLIDHKLLPLPELLDCLSDKQLS